MILSHISVRLAEAQHDGRLSLHHPSMTADGSMGPLTVEMLGLQVILFTQVLHFKCSHWSVFCSSTIKNVMLMHHFSAFVVHLLQILTPCLQSSMVLITTGIIMIINIITIIIIIITIITLIKNMWWETVWSETTMHHIHTHSVVSSIGASTTEF